MKISTKNVQRVLAAAGYYNGRLDGDIGPKMKSGISTLLERRADDIQDPNWREWTWSRKSVAALQIVLKYALFEPGPIDGWSGMLTEHAFYNWQHQRTHGAPPENWREDDVRQSTDSQEELDLESNIWPFQKHMTRFFGNPGGPQCTAGKVTLPFKMYLAWNGQIIKSFSCHEKVADSATRIYNRIASAYSPKQISSLGFDQFGGCYNFRNKRGGSTLSTHAYGIAIDHDPERNMLKWGRERANLAKKECEEFWRCWEAEGWVSLGRTRNFDWMHVQAARI